MFYQNEFITSSAFVQNPVDASYPNRHVIRMYGKRLRFWFTSLFVVLFATVVVVVPIAIKAVGGDSDLVAYAGNALGGVATLIGAAFAWFAIMKQIRMEGLSHEVERMETELSGLRETERLLSLILERIIRLEPAKVGHLLDKYGAPLFEGGKSHPNILDQLKIADERTRFQYRLIERIERLGEACKRGGNAMKNPRYPTGYEYCTDEQLELAKIEFESAFEDLERLARVLTEKLALYEKRLPRFREENEAFW